MFKVYLVKNSRFVQSFKNRRAATSFCRSNHKSTLPGFDWTDSYYIVEGE